MSGSSYDEELDESDDDESDDDESELLLEGQLESLEELEGGGGGWEEEGGEDDEDGAERQGPHPHAGGIGRLSFSAFIYQLRHFHHVMVKTHGLFSSFSDNIGDYIQTFAAEALLGGFDGFTDREALLSEKRECILVANGWWKHSVGDFPPPDHITPVYTGIHLARPELYNKNLAGHFNLHGPIGCRDDHTLRNLEKMGVSAYRSGCLTMSLARWVEPTYNGPVLAVDPPAGLALPPKTVVVSNTGPRSSHPSIMREAALQRLTELQCASMVITSRLHVALPCLAFGTPVVLLADVKDPRFDAVKDLVTVHDPKLKSLPEPGMLSPSKRHEIRTETKADFIKQVAKAVERHHTRRPVFTGLSLNHTYDKTSPGLENSLIPNVIHQFASSPGSLPPVPSECMQTVREFSARHRFRWQLWTPMSVESLLNLKGDTHWLQLLGACRNYGEYSDVARCAILYHLGGWWFDWDLRVMHPQSLSGSSLLWVGKGGLKL